jgi:hypothetical protein
MNESEPTERILEQGQALVLAIEALETIEPTGPIERVQVWFLLQAYRRRLRRLIELVPDWLAEEILSASQRIGDDRPPMWRGEEPWCRLLIDLRAENETTCPRFERVFEANCSLIYASLNNRWPI